MNLYQRKTSLSDPIKKSIKQTERRLNFLWSCQLNPLCIVYFPAGVSGCLISPFCDAMVPHSLHFPAMLGLCPGCLGSHHSAR